MLLYLRDENRHRIDTVELIDGCHPRITIDIGTICGEDSQPKEEYSVTKLEPALWGIILLLDRIYVDCQRRRFSWTTTGLDEINEDEGFGDPSYRTQYAEDECYDYNDDVDELFNLAQNLIKKSKSRKKILKKTPEYLNSIKEEQDSLIRMLYCYILPKVQIYVKDFPKVQEAIRRQTCFIQKIDEDIEKDSQLLDQLYQVLHMQQDERLDMFDAILQEKKCTEYFLDVFETDINKRINQLNQKLDESQNLVATFKEEIRVKGETVEKLKKLEEARRQSAGYHTRLYKLLVVARDTIKTARSDNSFLEKDEEEVLLDYIKSSNMLVKQKMLAKNQTSKKVHATSILENLKRVKDEVQAHGVASSAANSSCGQRPTDVIPDCHFPEYQTLSERVSAIVLNDEHPLGEEFQDFVAATRERCRDILDDAQTGGTQKRKKSIRESDERFLIVANDGTLQEEYLIPLENLSRDIKEHFRVMASSFQEHFNSQSTVLKNKLQLCYEENFYNVVGEDITKVYLKAHDHHKSKMIGNLERLAAFPINCLELGMKDEWWHELFEKRRKACEKMSLGSFDSRKSIETSSTSSGSPASESSLTGSSAGRTRNRARTSTRIRKTMLGFIRRVSREVTESSLRSPQSEDVLNGANGNMYNTKNDEVSTRTNGETSSVVNGEVGGHERITNGVCSQTSSDIDNRCCSRSNSIPDEDRSETMFCTAPDIDDYQAEVGLFEKHFGPSLESLGQVFSVTPIFAKLKCLTQCLRQMTQAVQDLRRQVVQNSTDDDISLAITGDDILPLIVLMILQMDCADAAGLQAQLKMLQDLIPGFLSAGCHGWAMMEFEMACQVLLSLCSQFDWGESFGSF